MSKKLCLTLVLVIALPALTMGFEKGTKSIGGSVGFSSYKPNSQLGTSYSISISPAFSYFVVKNLSLEFAPGLYLGWMKDQDTSTGYSVGLGFRYFYKLFYGGATFDYGKSGPKGRKYSSKYLTLRAGRMVGIAKNIYLDFGLIYRMGIGKYYSPLADTDNDSRSFRAQVGVQLFFK